ncbi:DUF3949 domain-containing protein [Gracilibacillus orientalis]|uniref:DUF3949 domain-containing protein n=1 Tax=Gracilibacillus orientalis TaxID=334253 RepID=UPI003CCBF94C
MSIFGGDEKFVNCLDHVKIICCIDIISSNPYSVFLFSCFRRRINKIWAESVEQILHAYTQGNPLFILANVIAYIIYKFKQK